MLHRLLETEKKRDNKKLVLSVSSTAQILAHFLNKYWGQTVNYPKAVTPSTFMEL